MTSRPKLLTAVGRTTSHARQKGILLTITHEAATQIKSLVTDVRHGLHLILMVLPTGKDSARRRVVEGSPEVRLRV